MVKKSVKKILYAEDDRGLRCAVAARLRKEGHRVWEVHNGKLAQEAMLQEEFDIILLDLVMPSNDPKGGQKVLRFMKENAINTPVWILTAFGHNGLASEAKRTYEAVIEGILPKTFDPGDVVDVVNKMSP